MMAKRLYLGRAAPGNYELGTARKAWRPSKGFKMPSLLKLFCRREFEEITGIKLKPGEIRRVKSITIDLEESS